jgi:HTH-type transcriptional regulator/antitoxin HipB
LYLPPLYDIVALSVLSDNLKEDLRVDTLLLHSPAQLPAHLKSLRKTRRLTQAQLAKRLGIGQSRLADIEKHPETVSSAQLLDLLAALGVEVLLRVKPTPKRIEDRPRGEW